MLRERLYWIEGSTCPVFLPQRGLPVHILQSKRNSFRRHDQFSRTRLEPRGVSSPTCAPPCPIKASCFTHPPSPGSSCENRFQTGCSFFIAAKHMRFQFFFWGTYVWFLKKNVQLLVRISLCFMYLCRSTTSSLPQTLHSLTGCTSRLSDQNIKDPNLAELQVNQQNSANAYCNWWLIQQMLTVSQKTSMKRISAKVENSPTQTNHQQTIRVKKKKQAKEKSHSKGTSYNSNQTQIPSRIGAPFSAKNPPRTLNWC